MSSHFCMVPGCDQDGRHALTLRCRRKDTSAIWAPPTGAFLCDEHATKGLDIEITVRPTQGKQIQIETVAELAGERGRAHHNKVPITQGPPRIET
jgi:hypothetical protein